jgi:hypothetical protein
MATKWNLKGTYFESCNCEAACPCVFLSDPTEGDCTVMVAWHIDQGSYGDVRLDGLNVVGAFYAPGNMIEVPWQAALYFDDGASQGQMQALAQIFSGQAGGHPARLAEHIGQVLGTRQVPIAYRAQGGRRSVQVGDVGEVAIEAMAGQGEGEVTIQGHPLAIAPGQPAVVARSEKLRYRDRGFQWELSERNGFFSPFTYQGP